MHFIEGSWWDFQYPPGPIHSSHNLVDASKKHSLVVIKQPRGHEVQHKKPSQWLTLLEFLFNTGNVQSLPIVYICFLSVVAIRNFLICVCDNSYREIELELLSAIKRVSRALQPVSCGYAVSSRHGLSETSRDSSVQHGSFVLATRSAFSPSNYISWT